MPCCANINFVRFKEAMLIVLVLKSGEQTNWSPAVETWLMNGKATESRSLHPVQILPAGWSSICLWLWHKIKAGGKPPQLVTDPLPKTASALIVWARKMDTLGAASVELVLGVIILCWVVLYNEAKKGHVAAELVLCSDSVPSALMLWITI